MAENTTNKVLKLIWYISAREKNIGPFHCIHVLWQFKLTCKISGGGAEGESLFLFIEVQDTERSAKCQVPRGGGREIRRNFTSVPFQNRTLFWTSLHTPNPMEACFSHLKKIRSLSHNYDVVSVAKGESCHPTWPWTWASGLPILHPTAMPNSWVRAHTQLYWRDFGEGTLALHAHRRSSSNL